jgi:hypothetical protein
LDRKNSIASSTSSPFVEMSHAATMLADRDTPCTRQKAAPPSLAALTFMQCTNTRPPLASA